MLNPYNNLVLIKGKDETKNIVSWKYEKKKPVVWVTFSSGKTYPYNRHDFSYYKNSGTQIITSQTVLKNNLVCPRIEKVLFFGNLSKLVYKSGYSEIVSSDTIKIVGSALDNPRSKNCFEYYKQIANQVGLKTEEGHNILAANYNKIETIREDTVLSDFLYGELNLTNNEKTKISIFPFSFNKSQKNAVDKALNSRLSVIEGPPGTGKTQTILNIIANAVMRNESVAVVSSNNSATANVYDKLKKYGIEFIAATLGNGKNIESFINSQNGYLPDISSWKLTDETLKKAKNKLFKSGIELDKMLLIKNQISILYSNKDSLEKEYSYFKDKYNPKKYTKRFINRISEQKMLEFAEEVKLGKISSDNLFSKLKLFVRYGLTDFEFLNCTIEEIEDYCQNEYYKRRIVDLENKINSLSIKLNFFDFDAKMESYSEESLKVFKANLEEKYRGLHSRNIYSQDSLKRDTNKFIKDYPVILSTTYSLASSLSHQLVYDYVIIDEASQVDLATGVLALSCAKKAVVVGDLKQLPNVVTNDQKALTDKIFKEYKLSEEYNYASNSLLSSVVNLFENVPRTLLKEHYRCHPEIIGFCNQRFYNGDLIILTEAKTEKTPLLVYKTPKGNHARGHYNQRQIDVIEKEVVVEQKLDLSNNSVGIVTPYRNQADLLKKAFNNTTVKCDTADKFQGQEKSVIIFSTVDNEISDFASDPNRLNVAVSRAIDQFIVVTDGNENDEVSPIHDLIGYIQYQNHTVIDSKISSVFDNLYKCNETAREKILKKYGRTSEMDSENLMYSVIKDVLSEERFSQYDVITHIPLRKIIFDLSKLDKHELVFATNHLTHVDFLIYSKLTYKPILAIEVDGFAYHTKNEKQLERDRIKNEILKKYKIPIIRFNTVGSSEKEKLIERLSNLNSR